jgi:hypothetical protein
MRTFLLAAALAALLPVAAHADVLTFDEAGDTFGAAIPLAPGYHGFDSLNVYFNTGADVGSGFAAGTVSSPNIGFNGFGAPASLTSLTAFTFNDGWFTEGFAPTTLTISGRDVIGGAVTHSVSFATTAAPVLRTFNWTGLAELDFDGGGQWVAFDNLRVNEAIPTSGAPEPAAWALMLSGFFGAGAMLRRRRAAATA